MTLWEGTAAEASHSFEHAPGQRTANLWWPADRAWFVVSDIDFDSTIVAGSHACVAAITSSSVLEALETSADIAMTSTA